MGPCDQRKLSPTRKARQPRPEPRAGLSQFVMSQLVSSPTAETSLRGPLFGKLITDVPEAPPGILLKTPPDYPGDALRCDYRKRSEIGLARHYSREHIGDRLAVERSPACDSHPPTRHFMSARPPTPLSTASPST